MQPKNKFQKQIVEASTKLPAITQAQIKWAHQHCIKHIGRRTKKGIVSCLECGHTWISKTTDKHCDCPNCNTKLLLIDTKQRVFRQDEYFCMITACEGFQVIRFFYLKYYAKVGEKAYYFDLEVVQRWIAPNGKFATMARLRQMGCFAHNWSSYSDLEIRHDKAEYNITPTCIYSRQKFIPEIKRSEFKGRFYDLTPFDLFHILLSNNKAETLLKTEQISLLQYFA